jgi:magnesium transporter
VETEKLLALNFTQEHPPDAALILERLSPDEAAAYFEQMPPRLAAAVLQKMVSSTAAECIARLSPQRFAQIVSVLPLDGTAALLRRLTPEQQEHLLKQAPPNIAPLLARLLGYPKNCAGALMDPLVLALPEDITVSEASARVRRAPRHALYYLYVIDRDQKLVGVLNLRELMLAAPRDSLAAVMHREVASLTALSDRVAITDHPFWRDVHALPVVDDHGVFLGVLRYETLRRIEDATKSPSPAAGALDAVLTFGELCWVGLARVLTDLTMSVGSVSGRPSQREEPTNG